MAIFTLTEDQAVEVIGKAKEIYRILYGKVSKSCINKGWEKASIKRYPLDFWCTSYGDSRKIKVIYVSGGDRLHAKSSLTINTDFNVRTLEACKLIIKELGGYISGDITIDSKTQNLVKQVVDIDIAKIDLDDLRSYHIVHFMAANKRKEMQKNIDELAVLEGMSSNEFGDEEANSNEQPNPEASSTKPAKKNDSIYNCMLLFVASIALMLAIFNPI